MNKLTLAIAILATGCASAWPSACKLNYRTGETKCACSRTVQTNKTMPDKTKRVSFMCDGKNLPLVFEANTLEAGDK
jgi:hypothetical protein